MTEYCNRCCKEVSTTEMKICMLDLKKIFCGECGGMIRSERISTGGPVSAPVTDSEFY